MHVQGGGLEDWPMVVFSLSHICEDSQNGNMSSLQGDLVQSGCVGSFLTAAFRVPSVELLHCYLFYFF